MKNIYKKIAIFFLLFISLKGICQPINVTGVATSGRFNTCGAGAPTAIATLLPASTGTLVNASGTLVCTNPCDTSLITISLTGIRWNQTPGVNWIHGIGLPNNPGVDLVNVSTSLATPAWIRMLTSVTGAPCSGQSVGGQGFYYDAVNSHSCCPGNPILDGNPANNWGDGSLNCPTPFNISFTFRICNNNILNGSMTFRMRGYTDGATGCWGIPEVAANNIDVVISTQACSSLFSPLPSASTVTKTCTPAQQFSTTFTGDCGNGNTITWWTAANGGTQIGTGNNFLLTQTTCPAGTTVYASCCPGNTVICANRRAFLIPNPCPPVLTITNVTTTNPVCPLQCGDINSVTVTGAIGAVSYTVMPENITNSTGIFTCLTGASHTVTVTDAAGCSVSAPANFVIPICGGPTTVPISYCQNATASPLTATLTPAGALAGATLLWYTTSTGGVGSPTAPTPSTAVVGPTTYYVSEIVGATESVRNPLIVTIVALPIAPVVTTPITLCQNSTTTALTATGSNLLWYTLPTGGVGSATAPVPNTTLAVPTTYYVSQTATGPPACEGPRAAIVVNIIATPLAPVVTTPISYCQNAPSTALTATGTNLLWYTMALGGVGTSTAPIPSTTAIGSITYYVSQSTTGAPSCEGPREVIIVNTTAIPAIPTITTTPPTCLADASSVINNYNALNTYTFTPAGPTVGAGGAITGMTLATNYTVTSTLGICTSAASASFSNVAILVTPAVPTVTTVPPTCVSNSVSTVSNYNALNTYTFTPSGPTVGAGGLISGMTVGTSYTAIATLGTCPSVASASFINAMMLVTPAVPTITTTAATCLADASSVINNYNALNTYTFAPTGPTVGAGGAITGMTLATNYTVTSTLGICTSAASASFSNAAILVTPAVPTVTTVPPTCVSNSVSTVSNYNAANVYTFTPAGPTVGAGGLISGMIVGTSYTAIATLGTCPSVASASFINAMMLVTPAVPTITTTPATCLADASSVINNYNALNTYTFTPAGPTVGAGGAITGMVLATSYTVTSTLGICTSAASASFSNAAILVTPAVPTITTLAPTCASNSVSTVSNYNAANVYTFTPAGPTVGAGGLISGMTVGTSYTVIATLGICPSTASASFSNAMMLVTPAIPTITTTPATCLTDASSVINNYNALNTYTFTPAGPTIGAGGAITGMVLATNYTVTSTLGICTSVASASFSNAAILVTPAVPTITTVPPTCASNGVSTVSNYNAANVYTFTPAGPTVGAGGLISGMIVGTSYTAIATLGTCPSVASASFINAMMLVTPAIPTITTTPATCLADASSVINNYNALNTYTFTPAGPTVGAGGAITGMTLATNYTVTSTLGICTSAASVSFINAAILVTPAVPTITTAAPTCASNSVSTFSNYNAVNTYIFTPAGPTVGAGGLISGMIVGTSYTVTATLGICPSVASASFSNAMMLVTPAVPTITTTAATCLADASSVINNYNALNTYTFTPAGPTVGAGGAITGMTLATNYTVTSGNATCTSVASASFSNAAILVTPAVPTITTAAPTCASNSVSTFSNYNAVNTYIFTPAGPTVGAGGLISGMIVGTSYTVTATLGICPSVASASFSNAMMLVTPAVPTITTTPATCLANASSVINNYNALNTYTFTPVGPTVGAGGAITGMTLATNYTVTSGNATCTSVASASFSNAAILVTPAVPTITTLAPTCGSNSVSTVSNYNAANVYTFTPAGPTVGAGGLISGMIVGTSYTVIATLGICPSVASASFSNAMMLVTPAVPTITTTPATCLANASSVINNYNALNTYTFTPTGPTVGAGGAITGMTLATNYTVTSGNATCTSVASASFSNAVILVTPAVPTITTVPPTCASNSVSTVSNYNAANVYTFTPAGPAVGAGGLISGMTVGTSYTVIATLGICPSASSSSFSNAMMLVTPAVPTITTTPATCLANASSVINNYNALNTYTFTPTGPTVGAGGAITGMTLATNYTVTSSNATCTSVASASFSNAAILVTPAVPTITTLAPTCASNSVSTVSNYNAANVYTFTPAGPTVGAGGLISGMTVGTSYTVTSSNTTCTSTTSASFINAAILVTPGAPIVNPSLIYCQNTPAIPLTATGSNLLWYTLPIGGTGTSIAPTPSTTTSGVFFYYVSQTVGICEGPRAVITINITATPSAPTVISPITYCPNDPAIPLTAIGTNLLWYTTLTGGGGSSTAPTPITSAPGSFNFYVSQTTSPATNSCEGPRALIVVNVNNNNLTVNLGNDTTICEGESVKFTPLVNPTPNNIVYQWRAEFVPASTIDNVSIKDATVNPVNNAVYILSAKINGCATEDTVNVNVRWKPIVDAGANKAICLLDSVLLVGSVTHTTGPISTYSWTPIDSVRNPSQIQTFVNPTTTKLYRLTVSTTKAVYGCDFDVYDSVKVIVQSISTPFAGNDTIAVKGIPHQLKGMGGSNYIWSTPTPSVTITNPFSQNAIVTLFNDANFYLKITDNIGCEGKDSIFVKVYDGPTYYVPNSFTPNADGINDIFRPIPVGISNTTYFRVFNRLGQLMFETNQWLKGWDGTFKGKPAASGSYVWLVGGTDKYYKKVEMKGSVLLIR